MSAPSSLLLGVFSHQMFCSIFTLIGLSSETQSSIVSILFHTMTHISTQINSTIWNHWMLHCNFQVPWQLILPILLEAQITKITFILVTTSLLHSSSYSFFGSFRSKRYSKLYSTSTLTTSLLHSSSYSFFSSFRSKRYSKLYSTSTLLSFLNS